jgi:drug/metabolite transporter (DMT)-like permease
MRDASAHPLRRALPLFLVAGLCFASLDATAKYLAIEHTVLLITWARYAGQMVVTIPFAWRGGGPGFWRTRRLGLQLVRSTMLLIATICFFGALRYLPLAEAAAVSFLAPIFIVLLSKPMLGERPTRARWAASIAGFLGILILLRPGSAVFHPATLLLFGMALSNALYQLLTRKLSGEDPWTTLFYSSLVGTLGMSVALPWAFAGAPFTAHALTLFALLGLFAGAGHWLLIRAYNAAPASLLTPFTYLQIIWATLYGYLVFGQLPDRLSALGMLVIVASGVLLLAYEARLRAR